MENSFKFSTDRGTPQKSINNGSSVSIDKSVICSGAEDFFGEPLLLSAEVYPTSFHLRQSRSTKIISKVGHASLFSTTINLFNTIAGAGMLGLPWALANTGVTLGIVWFLITAILEAYAAHLLAKCVLMERKYTFRALARKAMKFKGSHHLVNSLVAINGFGICCGYLIICGQLLPDLMSFFFRTHEGSISLEPIFWISIIVCGIELPLVICKSFDSLKFSSILGFVGTVYICILTVIYGFGNHVLGDPCMNKNGCPGDFNWGCPSDVPNLIRVASVFFFAFLSTQNIPTSTFELKRRSLNRINTAASGAIFMAFVIFILTALGGYRAFGDIVDVDVLKTFPLNSYSSAARLAITIVLITAFPIQMFPTKNCVCNIIFGLDAHECSNCKYYFTIFALLAGAWTVGICINDLSIILAFIGATTSIFIGFTLPTYFYIRLIANREGLTCDKIMSYTIFTMSLILSPLMVISEIYSLINAGDTK